MHLSAGYARILATSSVQSLQALPGFLPYTISKWSLMALQVGILAAQHLWTANGRSCEGQPQKPLSQALRCSEGKC